MPLHHTPRNTYRYWFNFLNCLLYVRCCLHSLESVPSIAGAQTHTYVHSLSQIPFVLVECMWAIWVGQLVHGTPKHVIRSAEATCEWSASNVHYIYFLIHYWYGKRRRKFIMYYVNVYCVWVCGTCSSAEPSWADSGTETWRACECIDIAMAIT